MKHIDIIHAMNTEQQPLHWTKKAQNDAVDAAVNSLEIIEKLTPFFEEQKAAMLSYKEGTCGDDWNNGYFKCVQDLLDIID